MTTKTLLKSFAIIFVLIFLIGNKKNINNTNTINIVSDESYNQEIEILERMDRYDLIRAMIQVESSGRVDAIGDLHLGEPSIGILQIRKVMVDDVNRILSLSGSNLRYTYEDRWDKYKSVEMFFIYSEYYHTNLDDYEAIARTWNGGPNGHRKKSTKKYWEKVNTTLNLIQ